MCYTDLAVEGWRTWVSQAEGDEMSDAELAKLPAVEIAARRDAMRDAIASARIEGGVIGPEARAIMELYCTGMIDADEMADRIRRRHVRP